MIFFINGFLLYNNDETVNKNEIISTNQHKKTLAILFTALLLVIVCF